MDAAAVANRLLDHLDAQRWEQAEVMFDATMQAAIPAARLGEVWRSLPGAGERGAPRVRRQDGLQVVVVPLVRGDARLNATVAVTADGRISGFLIQPGEPPKAADVPADAPFGERDFSVGEGDAALPGTLAMPKGDGPFPAVVLVHGSGPQDRDQTIGANRPFLDIARGLAAQGIAVLRYDKRSKAQPQAFATGDYTIDDETTDDAVQAVAALRRTRGIDVGQVFVLGHSQGAMMAPRIVQRAEGAAGAILLAAPARPL
ncbi:MAG: alpha/beta fold hydrolase, partial [Pseudoxanthomonas suwonensis]|nr:alpha/beta fold hydrolase [Pseudoxanthomonas suwonensis]